MKSPYTGIVIGVTKSPMTVPGTGVAHVAKLKKTLALVERSMKSQALKKQTEKRLKNKSAAKRLRKSKK